MDSIDQAQAFQERDNAEALARRQARIDASRKPRDARVDGICIDCGEAIDPRRLKAMRGCTSRCTRCGEIYEASADQRRAR